MTLFIVFGLVLAAFAGVLAVGAPYLPTLSPQVKTALNLADLKKGDHLLELGCGDGRVLLAAAKQGLKVTGYELNPLLYLLCILRTWRYRRQVRVIWGNFWLLPWPEAQAIFVFLLPKYMKKLDTKVMQYKHKPVKLISFAFAIPDKTSIAEKQGLFRYDYS